MADLMFERELERMFAEPPACGDADAFAVRVERKLARGWALRNLLIGALGLVGGVIAGAQLLGGGVFERLGAFTSQSERMLTGQLVDAASGVLPRSLPFDNQLMWFSAALAILGIGFAITRVVREF
jgi:hypothetical protein